MNIADSMKEHPVSDAQVKLRDELQAQHFEKERLIARLRQELALKEAYLLGMMEGNSDIAPTAEMLESLVG